MGCKGIIEKETEATIQCLGLRAWYGNRNLQIMENQMETEIEIGHQIWDVALGLGIQHTSGVKALQGTTLSEMFFLQ